MFESVSHVRPSSTPALSCAPQEPAYSSQEVARRVYVPWTRREALAILFFLALAAAVALASDTWGRIPAAVVAADRIHLLEVIP